MAGPISIAILANGSKARSELSSVGHTADGLGSKFGSLGKKMALGLGVGLVAAGAGITKWGIDSVKSLGRIERINAQTATAIKSTGGAAGVTTKHIENLSGKLENLTAAEAETTQENANLLLTFTNVRNSAGKGNKIFDQTVSTFTDMQRAIPSASMASLGKALNDPIKGISALTRVGVSFTEGQKSQIKGLVESGKTMKAQKIILGELNKEFGGSGEAFAKTTEGKIELAKHAFGTLGETIFAAVLPPLGTVAKASADFLNGLATKVGPAFATIKRVAGPALAQVKTAFTEILPVVQGVIAQVGPIFQTMATTFTTVVLPAVTGLVSYLVGKLVPVFAQVSSIISGQVIPIFTSVAQYIYGTLVPAVVAIYQKVATNLRPVFEQLVTTFQSKVLPTVSKLLDKFQEWQPALQKIFTAVVKVVGGVLEFAAAVLGKVLPPTIRFAGFLIATLVPAVASVIGVIIKIIAKVVDFGGALIDGAGKMGEFAGKVKAKIDDVIGFFTGLPGKIKGALSGAGTMLVETGKNIIRGLISGLDKAKQWVIDKVKEIADLVPGWVKRRLGIASPARAMIPLGRFAAEGLAKGIKGASAVVVTASKGLASKALEAIQTKIDANTSIRDSIVSIMSSIGGVLTGDLFGGTGDDESTALAKFRAGLDKAKTAAAGVADAVRKLLDANVSSGFLNNLLSSGNSELIVQLAGAPDVASLAAQYDAVIAQNEDTGRLVAEQVVGSRLDIINATLLDLERQRQIEEANRRAEEKAQRQADKAERAAERAADKAEKQRDREKPTKLEGKIVLDGPAVDQLVRGKQAKADITAYENSGGR